MSPALRKRTSILGISGVLRSFFAPSRTELGEERSMVQGWRVTEGLMECSSVLRAAIEEAERETKTRCAGSCFARVSASSAPMLPDVTPVIKTAFCISGGSGEVVKGGYWFC